MKRLLSPVCRGMASVLFALVCAAPATSTAAPAPLLLPLAATDLDLPACRAFLDGKPVAGDAAAAVLGTLGLKGGRDTWSAGTRQDGQRRDYLIVFARPLAVGSVLFQARGELRYLKAGAAVPNDADAAAAVWESVSFPPGQSGGRLAALPPGTQTQAFLCTLAAESWHDWHRFVLLRLFRPRLHNTVPDGLANGEAEYTQYHEMSAPTLYLAANVTRGSGSWQSHGPDKEGRTPRAPVTDVDPTWFVVSWDVPQAVCGLLLESNFRKFQLLAYTGPDGVNPAVGSAADWRKLTFTARDEGGRQCLTFEPQRTRGFKFQVMDAGGARFGAVAGLQAWIDLGEAPVPVRAVAAAAPPCEIGVPMPFAGSLSLAVNDAAGRRARNLLAREERPAGDLTVGWDLKDERGRFVQPGAYRWTALANPGLQIRYEMTPYPNIGMTAPANSPWLNGHSGPGGWLADHSAPRAVAVAGERVFLSAPCAESGVALIECDLDGRKAWGHHNLIAWTGPSYMASDGQALYTCPWAGDTDYVWRFTLPERKLDTMLQLPASATRKRGVRGLAARAGKLYLAVNGWAGGFANAVAPDDVDLDHCEPRYPIPQEKKASREDDPNPRADFPRLFRLTGTPAGNNGLVWLETDASESARQHIVLAFNKPVPIGTLVFPFPAEKELQVRLSVLKPDAPYPPKSRAEGDWNVFWKGQGKGWTAIPAPENTVTRALRISFDHGMDELDELGLDDEGQGVSPEALGEKKADLGLGRTRWQARLEGMKILRQRFADVAPACKVRVSSGTVNERGEWDAQRTRPLTRDNPAVYVMEWEKPQTLHGLAIQEIDGRFTEIDRWTGPDAGPVELAGAANWERIAGYEQKLRYYYQPDENHNSRARYMDGYVDFGDDVTTRALRLRVVEQWMWKEEGRAGCYGVRADRGGEELDPTRCRIYGVAALQALGGEAAVDPLTTGRIEVFDTATKKLEKEVPLAGGGALALAPDGTLYAVAGRQVVRVDLDGGKHTPLALSVRQPGALAVDRAGNLYVFDRDPARRVVEVFDPAGKPLRTIGTPGGRLAGPWDPKRFGSHPGVAVDIAVDGRDGLWVVECDFTPKRVSLWSTDGTFKKDFLGNTAYGGGGCLDRYDKTRLFYGPMEFSLDWQTGATALRGITWLGDSPAGEFPIRIDDRLYLVTRPLFLTQSVGVVYRYDNGLLRRVAAVGRAGNFEALRTSEILDSLGRKAIGYLGFAWSDRNGDGNPQAAEVEFFDLGESRRQAGRFEDSLAIDFGSDRFEVREFTTAGVPVYERTKKAFAGQAERLADGSFFVVGDDEQMRAVTAKGEPVWTHPAEGWGVHALYRARPWFPGQVVAQFGVVGHETAAAGGLGEFFVTHSNTGAWHVWSADGLLAGRLFRDMRGPGARPWSMLEHGRGLDLTGVTTGQEHFNGYFCRSREDNRYYVVAGHNHVSVAEVTGIDQVRRLGGEISVTPADIQNAIHHDRTVQARRLYEAAKVFECRRSRARIEVDGEPDEWDFESARLGERDVNFAMTYDDASLYLCWRVRGCGPLRNTGNDWRRLFKTGAAVDLQLGSDPAAPPDRRDAVRGDQRLLMTFVDGGPVAVLYQPVAPDATPAEAWKAETGVFKAEFARVVRLEGVKLAMKQDTNREDGRVTGYCAEAAVPLAALGLSIAPDLRLKLDWGVLVAGPEGSETFQRLYWANQQTAIVSDEAAEAQLHPDLWGWVRFSAKIGREGLESELDVERTMRTGTGGGADTGELKLEE